MGLLHWGDDVRIKKYGSTGTGKTSVVTIQLVTNNPISAGFIMSALADEQARERNETPAPAPERPASRRLAATRRLAAPLLALPAPKGSTDA